MNKLETGRKSLIIRTKPSASGFCTAELRAHMFILDRFHVEYLTWICDYIRKTKTGDQNMSNVLLLAKVGFLNVMFKLLHKLFTIMLNWRS